jgi:hypothetical protein
MKDIIVDSIATAILIGLASPVVALLLAVAIRVSGRSLKATMPRGIFEEMKPSRATGKSVALRTHDLRSVGADPPDQLNSWDTTVGAGWRA